MQPCCGSSVDLSVNHIEFVPVQDGKILVILVFSNGHVENRLIEMPLVFLLIVLLTSNYMNGHYKGKPLSSIVQLLIRIGYGMSRT